MDTLEQIKKLWEHACWADRKLLEAIESQKDAGHDARREFSHVIAAEEIWLARLEQRISRCGVWPALGLSELTHLMEQIHEGYRTYLGGLNDTSLGRVIAYTNSAGQSFSDSIADILLHVVLHGHYHRGKVNLFLRLGDHAPAPTDYIAFVRGAPAATEATSRKNSNRP